MGEPEAASTRRRVGEFIDEIIDKDRQQDSRRLLKLMERATGEKPQVWGKMVGFGNLHYKYASGREGDTARLGFAPRRQNLTLYFMSGFVGYEDLLGKLGKYTRGKSCLYVKRLDDVDEAVLVELMKRAWVHLEETEKAAGGVPRMSEMPLPKKHPG